MLTLMSTMATVRRQTSALNFETFTRFGEKKEDGNGLEDQCEEQKAEIKRLRTALHEAERGAREAKREL